MPKKLDIELIPNGRGKLQDHLNPKKILGYDMFKTLYSNIFLLASTSSGKTTTIYNILKHCADKNTFVVFFVSTIHNDPSYAAILKYLDEKNIQYEINTSIFDGRVNKLKEIINDLEACAEEEKKASEPVKPKLEVPFCLFNEPPKPKEVNPEKPKKKKKPKYISPNLIFIFDDLSSELKDKSIPYLVQKSRHYKCKVIMSSQYLRDIKPAVWQNLHYALIFGGITDEKLESIKDNIATNEPLDKFLNNYHKATEEKYNFLYYDIKNIEYRKNFNKIL